MIRPLVDAGKVIIDSRYENEDSKNPTAYNIFSNVHRKMIQEGAFNHIGTVVIDSFTMLCEAVMNEILRKLNKAGTTPFLPNYGSRQSEIISLMRVMCDLPCDFVLTTHVDRERDEFTGGIISTLKASKGLIGAIPPLFDEILIPCSSMDTDGKLTYRVQTASANGFTARTRMSKGAVFDMYEQPNIMHLRRKAGFPCEHLPVIGG